MIWFISVLFVCWNLFCTIANLRIKCVTETKNVSVLFYKNVKSSFSTWLTHFSLRCLYILGCSGPRCGPPDFGRWIKPFPRWGQIMLSILQLSHPDFQTFPRPLVVCTVFVHICSSKIRNSVNSGSCSYSPYVYFKRWSDLINRCSCKLI